jgi:hypothetical protein
MLLYGILVKMHGPVNEQSDFQSIISAVRKYRIKKRYIRKNRVGVSLR